MIRISVENCMNAGPKFLFFFVRIAALIVIMISIRAVFLRRITVTSFHGHFVPTTSFHQIVTSFQRIVTSFHDFICSNFQPRIGTRNIIGGAKFSEIKVQKTRVVLFAID